MALHLAAVACFPGFQQPTAQQQRLARAAGLLGRSGQIGPEASARIARPWMCLVPTTCASGAEGAAVAVFSDEGRKVPVASRSLLADHVVLDARFLESLTPFQLAASLGDVASHALEAFLSIVPNSLAKEGAFSALHSGALGTGRAGTERKDFRAHG